MPQIADAPAASSPVLEGGTVATHPDALVADLSTVAAEEDSPPSPDEIAVASFDEHLAKTQGKPEAPAEEPPAEAPAEDKPAEATVGGKTPDDLSHESEIPKPFTERTEWKELTALGDKVGKVEGAKVRQTLRTMLERETTMQRDLLASRPAVEAVQDLIAQSGSEQGFRNLQAFIRQYNADPAGSIPMLKTLLADAEKRAGLVIQSADLLTAVQQVDKDLADGAITPEYAAQRKSELTELETHRATAKRITVQTDQQRQEAQRREQATRMQAVNAEINQTEHAWTTAKAKADPDFSAVQPTFDKFAQLEARDFIEREKRAFTAAEGIQILEKAYRDAKADAARYRPRRQAISPTRDTGLSRNTRHLPQTSEEKYEARYEDAKRRHGL